MSRIFDRLYALQWAVDEEGQQQSVAVALTSEARAEWVAYYSAHNLEQLELTGEMSAAWSKLEEYAARLALVIHCIRWAAGEAPPSADSVDAESMTAAVRLAEWFKLEARRVYAMLGETPEEGDRRRLLEWLERRSGAATAREAQQGCRWLATAQEADAALEELVKSGQAYWEPSPTGQRGQPTRRCVLLTAVYGNSAKPGENTNTVDVDSVDASEIDSDMGDWGEV